MTPCLFHLLPSLFHLLPPLFHTLSLFSTYSPFFSTLSFPPAPLSFPPPHSIRLPNITQAVEQGPQAAQPATMHTTCDTIELELPRFNIAHQFKQYEYTYGIAAALVRVQRGVEEWVLCVQECRGVGAVCVGV